MSAIPKAVFAASLALAAAVSAAAHHSAAAYDTSKEVSVTGRVTQYTFKNPHVYLTVQVKKADGSTASVEVEAGAPSVLSPLGFSKASLAIGETVTVSGNPSRTSGDKVVLGKDLYKQDGAYLPLNIASRSVYAASNETASTIAGTWFSPRTEFNAFMGGARNWPVTEKGRKAMSSTDPKATTQKDCIPVGAPLLMFYPVANTITVQRDRVVIKVDWMDAERIVYLDGRKHPPANQTTLLGHSVGRWEGNALVVETTNFKEHEMGLSMSLPSSSNKKLMERFSLSADRKGLVYSGVIEDPVYLTKSVEWSGQWVYRPGMPHSNEKCDINTARKFLKD